MELYYNLVISYTNGTFPKSVMIWDEAVSPGVPLILISEDVKLN